MGSPLFSFAWVQDFESFVDELSKLAMNDSWDYKSNPSGEHPILKNYIHHTFAKVQKENKIEILNEYATFNTGLVTLNQEEIYGYFNKNKKPQTTIEWYFLGWRKKSDRDLIKFLKLPDIAN